jgi:formylglycine-generating enzyme required for sulfatase activity
MFRTRLIPVWVGILCLSGMFLMGQDTWGPTPCTDLDGDGYGNPASTSCANPELDCDDTNAAVNPGVTEESLGDPICQDGMDNDCDGLVDGADTGCLQCSLPVDCDDDNPCTDDDCVAGSCVNTNNVAPCDDGDVCTEGDICSGGVCSGSPLDTDGDGYVSNACGGDDCNDSNAGVNPGATEGPYGDPVCSDTLDNDCDGSVDGTDTGCAAGGGPMAQIPAGCFDMGDSSDGCSFDDRCPVHNVCISAFEMDVHEVTNAQYAECVAAGGCTEPSSAISFTRTSYYGNPAYADFPVIYVDWYQANAYCTWAGKRLPTEAEWEYAARGGLSGNRYPWGDAISGTDANYSDSGDPWDNDTSPVEYYAPNGYGLYDVAGNVWEWTNDWYSSSYYHSCVTNGIVNDPTGPATGTYRVLRGGSWRHNTPTYLQVAARYADEPDGGYDGLGLRCSR